MNCDCDYILPECEDAPDHYDNCSSKWEKEYQRKPLPKNKDGTLRLPNKLLQSLDVDVLYHLGLDTEKYDLVSMFGDVKFVCMGGTKYRMREFAEYMRGVLNLPQKEPLINLTKHSQRYAMYKVGPVLSVSHGIGIPSMTTLLQEVIKLLQYSKAKDPVIFRIGTSGGLGIPSGSVVVTTCGVSGVMENYYEIPILGKVRKLPSILDSRVCREVYSLSSEADGFTTYLGKTMAADDFYRGQARLDGPFCNYTVAEKMEFLTKLSGIGVRNIEMECTAFAAFTKEAGIRAGIVCVTYLDRLLGDQVKPCSSTLKEWQKRPMIVVGRYIKESLSKKGIRNGNHC